MTTKAIKEIKWKIKLMSEELNLELESLKSAKHVKYNMEEKKVSSIEELISETEISMASLKEEKLRLEMELKKELEKKESKKMTLLNPNFKYKRFLTATLYGVVHGKVSILMIKDFEINKADKIRDGKLIKNKTGKLLIYVPGSSGYVQFGGSAYSEPELYICNAEYEIIDNEEISYKYDLLRSNLEGLVKIKLIDSHGKKITYKKALKENINLIKKEFGNEELKYPDFVRGYTIML